VEPEAPELPFDDDDEEEGEEDGGGADCGVALGGGRGGGGNCGGPLVSTAWASAATRLTAANPAHADTHGHGHAIEAAQTARATKRTVGAIPVRMCAV
jgi:hypothetical protein